MRFEHWFYMLPLRWRSIARRRAVDRELDEGIEFHVQQEVDELAVSGMDPREARRLVVSRFGALDLAKERSDHPPGKHECRRIISPTGRGILRGRSRVSR